MRKKYVLIISLILVIIMILGVSYALLQKDIIGSSGKIIYKIGDLEVKLDDSSSKDISLTNAIPQEDSEGLSSEPYSFLLINNGTTDLKYTIYLEDDKEAKNKCGTDCELVPYKFIRYNLASDSESLKTSNLSTTSNALYTGTIKSKATDKFNLRVWLSIDADNTAMNKYYFGKIKVVVGQGDSYCKDNGFNTLSDCMLVMNNHESSVDIAKTNIKAKGTPDFSKTATTDEGLFMAEDDEGESYYYRGAVKNNYVSFAGFIWRIIRRNGDGSIRLIYAGKKTSDTGDATTIGNYPFNNNFYDYTFIGYKYNTEFSLNTNNNITSYTWLVSNKKYDFGTSYIFDESTKKFKLAGDIKQLTWEDNHDEIVSNNLYSYLNSRGTIIYKITGYSSDSIMLVQPISYGSTSYDNATTNTKDSNIKTVIDKWYKNNILNYSSSLADEIFCNDRSIWTGTGYKIDSDTMYETYNRLKSSAPSLRCSQDNDKFKISNTNAKLDYSIALITSDEVAMAGGAYNKTNTSYYLYNGKLFWTLSPSRFDSLHSTIDMWHLRENGNLNPDYDVTVNFIGVRPVINLKPDVKITSGDGTSIAPYKID
mgnify:CR=1 FL=1